jgi:predicted acyltransferase
MPSDNATTAAIPSAPQTPRILSIDIFRGLTMLVMVFVNDLAFVKGLPWWTYHIPGGVNGMTYVDVVFPAFLFIVGVSIPPAVRRRIDLGDSPVKLWCHILLRSLSLVVLGIILANSGKLDPERAGISSEIWSALAFLGRSCFGTSTLATAGIAPPGGY